MRLFRSEMSLPMHNSSSEGVERIRAARCGYCFDESFSEYGGHGYGHVSVLSSYRDTSSAGPAQHQGGSLRLDMTRTNVIHLIIKKSLCVLTASIRIRVCRCLSSHASACYTRPPLNASTLMHDSTDVSLRFCRD